MKKFLITALSLTVLSGQSFAQLFDRNDWERPILASDMVILNASGELSPIREAMIYINKRDGAIDPTSLSLKYATEVSQNGIATNPNGVYRTLEIDSIVVDRCNSVHYTAQKRYPLKRIRETLVVTDHGVRFPSPTCAIPEAVVEAVYTVERNRPRERAVSHLVLESFHPLEAVYTIH